jgi:hypothetical protein
MFNYLMNIDMSITISFLFYSLFFFVVLYFSFLSIKDLIIDYLPDLMHTIFMWKNLFIIGSLFLGILILL